MSILPNQTNKPVLVIMVKQNLVSFPCQVQKHLLNRKQRSPVECTDDFVTTKQATGPEIKSSIAGKIFWNSPLKQESFKKKLDLAAIPSNCEFLIPKKVNGEIWSK